MRSNNEFSPATKDGSCKQITFYGTRPTDRIHLLDKSSSLRDDQVGRTKPIGQETSMEINRAQGPGMDRRHDEIVARFPKEDVKALFYILAGKPDSVTKVFHKAAIITPVDIQDLHSRVAEKLDQHQIDGCVVTVTIVHEKGIIKDF